MLLGADPDDLDRLATAHETCAAHLARVRTRLRLADRAGWRGPSARRWWAALDGSLIPGLVHAGSTAAASARGLRAHAREQRRASLPPVSARTVHLDRAGDGRWVGRVGQADAAIVVVLVPGVGSDLRDLPRLRADAVRLWQVLASHGGPATRPVGTAAEDIAVVSWLGYDPPDHVLFGVDGRPASAAAPVLAGAVTDLRRRGGDRIIVVGHSYGGLVAARAEASGMDADELVLLGAPGLGVAGTIELGLAPGADVWVAQARLDPVTLVARAGLLHGPDPADLALSLPTSRDGHSSYLRDPVLLDSLAALVLEGVVPAVDAVEGSGTPW